MISPIPGVLFVSSSRQSTPLDLFIGGRATQKVTPTNSQRGREARKTLEILQILRCTLFGHTKPLVQVNGNAELRHFNAKIWSPPQSYPAETILAIICRTLLAFQRRAVFQPTPPVLMCLKHFAGDRSHARFRQI